MLDASHLVGIIPALVTPLHADESLDEPALRRLVQHVVRGGVHGVFVMGTTGEFAALTDDNRRQAVEVVVDEVKGAVPVLVGVSETSTRRALRRAEHAQGAGADALVSTMPYYNHPTDDAEICAHFEALTTATPLPVMIYNIPQYVGASLTLEAVEQLRELPQVLGIKDSSEDFNLMMGLVRMESAAFRVFQGSEVQAAATLLMGAHGCVTALANLAPKLWVGLYDAVRGGELSRVRELHRIVCDLRRIYAFEGTSAIGGLKAALEMIGICQANPARPLRRADTQARARIEGEIKRFRDYI